MTLQSTDRNTEMSQVASQQDMTGASQTVGFQVLELYNMATSNPNFIPDVKKKEVFGTLCARDYKGLSNFGSNGVLCRKKK